MKDKIEERILSEVADLHGVPEGAYNIRVNGKSEGRKSTANIEILPRDDGKGLTVKIRDNTVNESVHIPVVLSESGLTEVVYNDFVVGDNCNVVIVAGCGIHNCGAGDSRHDGIHRFFIGNNSRVRYVEKHYGEGNGEGKRILNPVTEITVGENSTVEMEMVQIKGVDSTDRKTTATLGGGSKLIVRERLMTHGDQKAVSTYDVLLNGNNASADVVSRSVAKDNSYQEFSSRMIGNTPSSGHTECDAIIMDKARVVAIPSLEANNIDAALIHEAAIGKIAGEQLIKLMTLGLTEAEAEEEIINGFLG